MKKAFTLALLFVLWLVGCGERPKKSTGSTFESRQGTPIISINYGGDFAKHSGILTHVGQTEYDAGYEAGEKIVSACITQGICVNKEVGNLSLDLCQGLAAAVIRSGGTVEVLTVDLADPTETQQRIAAVLTSKSEVNGLLTLGTTSALATLKALEDLGKFDQIILATFI